MTPSTLRPIFLLWFQGWRNAPPIVKQCARSWQVHNPDHTIVRLDNQSLQGWLRWKPKIPGLDKKQISRTSASDIVRLGLLRKYGGVWADATTFCTRPLDDWLTLGDTDRFFAFRSGNARQLSTWFLAAEPGSGLVDRWYAATIDYWSRRDRMDDYYWCHHLFAHLCRTDPAFAEHWASVPSRFNKSPHFFHRHGFAGPVNDTVREHVEKRRAPLYKLTWKRKGIDRLPRVKFLLGASVERA